ncbi:TPA: TonB-dependent hemoglobin/transferrin/lactoferrin family receptor [Haemophilus influenzae]|uniref:TonB-dependent hemoglobin/transferrin/lactoferrin family receptor n=1 Tax=Haemophilus influenzae TaxID=727 RepID=UPI00014FC6B0|nr:TonB-dependent hemoglobin/transferrin/lactoferrin family receptor [Haemophilus influenzae]EDK09524.1 heme-hemopexin utilization protein C [Haemophilus influenzae PittHH]MCK8864533.1 TonB-dependent hemoglobin/transferrin/lactoferrin family receptor [Haemophilus influenzae]MDO7258628.1 TonB-dependent hemoglobin/transferrin/lactoferrin family receptor [Haemophilus influenzae]MDO7276483.1 TonB-dependent hemoglobin/transferrin/lactoferrin family receptor [Haemophilus influenzae]OKQ05274.1 ligand
MRFSKLSLAIATTLVTQTVLAQSTELDSINVIATRDPSRFAYTPEKQSKDSLLSKQATSVAAALEDIPNVDIRGGSRSIAQKPNIRGLSDNRVVQVIDGVRQNFDLAHRGSYFLPMSLIQEIEVIKGPSSSLWGSGALGGVVAMRTPNALDLLKNNDKFGVKIRQGYQTANNLSERDVSVFAANDKFDVLISGFYNNADNLRTGKGNKLNNTAYKQFGGLAKFGWQINDANRVELSHRETRFKQTAPSNNEVENELTNEQITDQIREFHGSNNGLPPRTKLPSETSKFYSGVKTRFGSVSYLTDQQIPDQSTVFNYYLTPDNPYLNTHIALYNNKTIEKEQRKVSGVKDQTKLTTRGINLRNSSELSHISFVYGVDYMRDKISTERGTNSSDAKFRAEPYNANSNTTGVYLIAHIPLFGEKLLLSPSVRYDHYDTSSKTVKYKDNHLSPATKLTWKVTNWLDLSAKYNEAFRAPSMQERFVSGAHFGTDVAGLNAVNKFIANPNLRPETAKNKEITANLHFDSLFKQGDKFKIEATYFRNDVKDFINLKIFNDANANKNASTSRALLPTKSQYQNITNARLSGIELQAQYQTERLTLFTNYGSTKGKDKDSGEALSNIAASKIGVGVNYALVKDKFTVGATVTHYAAQHRVPKDHAVTYPSYILTDLRATYAPLKGEWKNLRLDFALENLFDRKYQPAFSLMEGTGRNAKISAVYSF